MVDLVTLDQVNLALKLDLVQSGSPLTFTDARVPDVQLKMIQAQAVILGYLKVASDKWTDADVPGEVTAAILLGIRGLYDGDDSLLAGLYDNDRANPIVGLLQRLRDPALA